MTIEQLTTEQVKELAKTSAYTITGAGGDLDKWTTGYTKLLNEQGIRTPKNWFTFCGEQMNAAFELAGDCRFKSDITFLAFTLDGLNIGKLAIFKMRMEDRWFDDIVDNSIAEA